MIICSYKNRKVGLVSQLYFTCRWWNNCSCWRWWSSPMANQ